MAIVVNCPECQRKLKIAPTSIGKSVKCPCGNVFKANEAGEPPPAPTTPAPTAPATLVVACDNCQAKLKVPASARGRKMKCSKCSATFVVPADETPAAPPEWSSPAPPAGSTPMPPAFKDEEPADEPRPARKPAHTRPPFFEDAETDEPAPMKKSAPNGPPFIEDDEGAIASVTPPPSRAKGKPAARAAAVTAPVTTPTPAPTSGCGGCVLSIFVLLIVVAYIGVFVPLYFFRPQLAEYVELPFHKPPAEHGKALRITPHPEAEVSKQKNEIEPEKKDDAADKTKEKKNDAPDKEKKNDAPDKEKKNDAPDKEKKNDAPDKDAKDTEGKSPTRDLDGAALFQLPMPTIMLQPRLDSGRPAKPGTRFRTARRATAAD